MINILKSSHGITAFKAHATFFLTLSLPLIAILMIAAIVAPITSMQMQVRVPSSSYAAVINPLEILSTRISINVTA